MTLMRAISSRLPITSFVPVSEACVCDVRVRVSRYPVNVEFAKISCVL